MNQKTSILVALVLSGGMSLSTASAQSTADAEQGQRLFRACAACHSLEPGRHLTGPSLAGIWGKKAGTVAGFNRYSQALKDADIAWNRDTLDPWLANPQAMIPGNRMTFAGLRDAQARADIIAYLEKASEERTDAASEPAGGTMQGAGPADLGSLGPEQQVAAIRHCGDTYHVTTRAGEEIAIWEFNLRIKTDSSDKGPSEGQPALMPSGMMGDRASVIFASPAEVSPFIEQKC